MNGVLTCMLVLVARQRAVLGEHLVTLIAGEDLVAKSRTKVEGEGQGILEEEEKVREN